MSVKIHINDEVEVEDFDYTPLVRPKDNRKYNMRECEQLATDLDFALTRNEQVDDFLFRCIVLFGRSFSISFKEKYVDFVLSISTKYEAINKTIDKIIVGLKSARGLSSLPELSIPIPGGILVKCRKIYISNFDKANGFSFEFNKNNPMGMKEMPIFIRFHVGQFVFRQNDDTETEYKIPDSLVDPVEEVEINIDFDEFLTEDEKEEMYLEEEES